MARYADIDVLLEHLTTSDEGNFRTAITQWLEMHQIEDVAPIIHAHWRPSKEPKHEKEFSRFFVCTNCSHDIQLRNAGIVEDIGFEYCPHCGAKMDEEVE